jgi:hypothetical protein
MSSHLWRPYRSICEHASDRDDDVRTKWSRNAAAKASIAAIVLIKKRPHRYPAAGSVQTYLQS